ncbi:LysR family transcriptional regulator, partial [Salmonella enterica]|uniref:LysR family transcriptional regulator n=1 Tax=Salmonella enterica TaxID=28901 RepID=UPI00398C56C4
MHITPRQLEVFAAVLKICSTTHSSVMRSLSHSAFSAALPDLEGQLCVQLFDRVGNRLVVNYHGRLLYPLALALPEQALLLDPLLLQDNGPIPVYSLNHLPSYLLLSISPPYPPHLPLSPPPLLGARPPS